ncbi:unnamed protein product [Lampetra fluviatilis]
MGPSLTRAPMAPPGAVMDAEHPGAVLRRLDEQRGRGTFCDVTIIVGDHKFRAHRNVLAASSPYFSELLFARGAESGGAGANRVLEISFVRAEVFAEILNFIYSSKLSTERGAGGGDDAALSELVSSGEKLGMRFLAGLEKSPGSPERRETPVPAPPAAETPRAPRPAPAVKKELSEKEALEASDGPRILSSYSIPQMEKAAAAAKAAVREARRENCPAPAAAPVPAPPATPSSCSLYDVHSVLADAFLMALEHSYAMPPEPLRAMLNARCQGRRGTAPPPGRPCRVPDAPRPLFGCGRCPRTFDGADSLRVHERSHRSFLVQCDHCRRPFLSERLLRAHTCLLRPPPPPLPPLPPPVSVTAETPSSCAVVKLVLPVARPRVAVPAPVASDDDDDGDGPPPCVRPPVPGAERDYGEPEAETRGVYNKSGSKAVFSGTLRRRRPSLEPDHYARVVEGQVLYFCSVCDRSYVQLTSLKRHSNVHSWTKQYPCRYCERVFALAEYRTKHEIWHTGERRYQCIFCSEAFLTYHFLKTHQRTQHGVNPCKTADGGGPAAVAQDPLVRFYRLLPRQVNKRLYRTYRSLDYSAPRAAADGVAPPAAPSPSAPPAGAGLKVEEDAGGTGSDEADDAADGQITVSIADDRPDEEPYSPEPDLRPPKKRGRKRMVWTRDGGAAGRREHDEDSDSDQEWKDSSWKPYYSYKPKRKGPRGPRGRRRRRGWRGTTRSSGAFGFGGEAESSGGGSEPGYATRRRSVEAEAAGAATAGRPDAADSAGGFGVAAVAARDAEARAAPWVGEVEGLAAGAEPDARQPVRLSRGDDGDGGGSRWFPVENATRDEADSGKAAAAHGFYTVDGRGVRRSAEDIAIAEKLLQMGELTPLTPPPPRPPPPPPPAPRPAYLDPQDGNDVLLDLTFGKHRVAHCDPGPARPFWADAGNAKRAFETPNDNLGYFGAVASGRGEDECRGLDLSTSKEHVDGCGLDGIPSPCSSDEEDCAPASAVDRAPSSRLVKGMYPCVYCDKVFPFRCRWMKHQLADHNGKTLNQQMLSSSAAKENCDDAPGDGADGRRGGGRWGGAAEQRPWEPGARPDSDGAGPGGGRTGDERGEFKCFYCPRVLRTLASRSAHHTWHRRWLKAAERRAKFCPPPRADDPADRRHRYPPCSNAFDAADSPAARRRRRERRPAPPADPAGPSRGWGGAPRGAKFRCCCCPRVLKTAAARALHQKSHGMTASPPSRVRHVAAAAAPAPAYEQAL